MTILLTNFISAQTEGDVFVFDPNSYDLGTISNGDNISISFDAIYTGSSPHDYKIDKDQLLYYNPWISSISPEDNFTVSYYGDGVTVNISGIFQEPSNFGTHFIDVVFRDTDSQSSYVQTYQIQYKSIPSAGIEDYIEFYSWENIFSEGDMLTYDVLFQDVEPFGDYITEWNLKINLTTTANENFTYVDIDEDCCQTEAGWQFIAPQLPNDIFFKRNSEGQIKGLLTVTGIDNLNVVHVVDLEIGINKAPDPPILYTLPQENGVVKVVITNSGGTSNVIYYDMSSGAPYNGSGLDQGDSPLNIGNLTTLELTGFQECSKYYFSAKATNQYGTSNFANESQIMIFSSENGMPVYYHNNDTYISEGYELTGNHYFMGNLIVETGTELTLTGGILYFEEDSRIIIEPRGKLILDGTLCTAPCGQTWKGIEVWGNKEETQFTINDECPQGILELKGGATIENAEIGVLLSARNEDGSFDHNKDGGIIKVQNVENSDDPVARFINNKWSVNFQTYHNFSPFNPDVETGNLSFIKHCDFEINQSFLFGDWYYSHIYLFDVKGIQIKGNTFVNNYTANPSGHGINSYHAGFLVTSLCDGNYTTCPEEHLINNTFTNFTKGINLGNAGHYTITVKNAVFNNNSYGIMLSSVDYATLLFNKFYLGEANAHEEELCDGKSAAYGIDMTNCIGFAVEENKFFKAEGAPLGNYIGIRVTDCPTESEIYLNEFYGVSVGNQAEGYNRPEASINGVSYICNRNYYNNYDFYVADESVIAQDIGGYEEASGNKVSSNAEFQFQNDYTSAILYFYNQNEPDEVLSLFSDYVLPIAISNGNTCPSHFGSGGTDGGVVLTDSEKQAKEAEYLQELNDYNGVQALYTSLLDGGNTEALKTDVETSWPDDMWELRAELLGKSPHLSKEVLIKVADKTDVLPESILFEILSANPDELRKEELIKYLEDKNQPLPQYMIDILRQLANGTTYKTVLLSEMASHHSKMVNAAQDIIRSIINEDEPDMNELRNWLDNIGTIEADKQIIDTYISEGNYVQAQSLIDMLPGLYDLSDEELEKYNDYKLYKQILIGLAQENRTIFGLTETELSSLESLAETGIGSAKTLAQGVLEFAYDYDYCNCPDLPEGIGLKSSSGIDMDKLAQAMGLDIVAEPNPTSTWAAFDYSLPPYETTGVIEITDNFGKVKEIINITQQKGQYILDTRNYKTGIYYYTLKCSDLHHTGKLIVK